MGTKLSTLGEFGLIKRLVSALRPVEGGVIGPGDDCAVFRSPSGDASQVITTDTMVENRHFRLSTAGAYDVGWKCVAATLSDIASMGAQPKYLLLNLQLRRDLDVEWLDEFYRGVQELSSRFAVSVLGGDVVCASELAFTSTGIGFCRGAPLMRSGACAGDELWMSGRVGESRLGLALLESSQPDQKESRYCSAHLRPIPRVELGLALGQSGAVNSCIDISDGLLQDAGHLAERSSVALEIELARVGRPETALLSDAELLSGGEDYELLFTLAPDASLKLTEVLSQHGASRIGRVLPEAASRVRLKLPDGRGLSAQEFAGQGGFDHFLP